MQHENCGRCNRRLKSAKSREIGFGPSCHKKVIGAQAPAQRTEVPEKEKATLVQQDDPNQVVWKY